MDLLVIVTKMNADKGDEDDEFTKENFWGQPKEQESAFFHCENRGVLVIHGHSQRSKNSQTIGKLVREIDKDVFELFKNLKGKESQKNRLHIGFLYHWTKSNNAPKRFEKTLGKRFLDNDWSVDFQTRYSSENVKLIGDIKSLAKRVLKKKNTFSKEFDKIFDNIKKKRKKNPPKYSSIPRHCLPFLSNYAGLPENSKYQISRIEPALKSQGIYLIDITDGDFTKWVNFTDNIFREKSLNNKFFVFCWKSPRSKIDSVENSNKIRFEHEKTDNQWGYSRFVRDFLKGYDRGIEIDFNLIDNLDQVASELDSLKSSTTHCNPIDVFNTVSKLIGLSLKSNYGDKFPIDKFLNIQSISTFYTTAKVNLVSPGIVDGIDYPNILFTKNIKKEIDQCIATIHKMLGDKNEWLYEYSKSVKYFEVLGGYDLWENILRTFTTLTECYILWREDYAPSFLLIDDKPSKIVRKMEILKIWFPKSKIFYTEEKKWKILFKSIKKEKNLSDLRIQVKQIDVPKSNLHKTKIKFVYHNAKLVLSKVDYLLIDLEYEDENKGFELLHELQSCLRTKDRPSIITLSRREDADSIQRALNSGALLYIAKNYFFELIPEICQLEAVQLKKENNINNEWIYSQYSKYENWHLLNKLSPKKIFELKSTRILGTEYNPKGEDKRWKTGSAGSADYRWIGALPKADIHCHIGSCMGSKLLPKTALVVIGKLLENNRDQFPAKIDEIIKFLLPIASDPCLSEDNSIETPIDEETTNYKSSFGFRGKERKSIFEIIEEVYPLRESEVLPEVALLDPNNSLLDERARFFPEYDSSHYFQSKKKLKKMGVTYDEIMLVFLILLYIRDECKINEQQNGLRKLRDEVLSDLESALNSKDQELNRKVIVKNTSNFINLINNRHDIASTVGAMKPTNNIIHFLQSAHSTKRCIDQTRASLFNYLRGCEYAGAAHLQSKASIYLTIRSIVEDYAIQDKIRYLCLRCSVDGYSKFGLQPNENIAMENLLKAISFYTNKACREGNKIRVNVIVTAKRHKSLKEFDKNAALALKYRFGLDKQGESSEDQPAFPGKPKVVSFDLAGKEKKYPTIKFLKNFQPLLEKCFPITIHAGEEEDKDAIWDAVYHVHTQRIGHALSLRQDDRLLDIVRERHIAIELCPLSNVLTNGRYKFFEETKIKEELDKCDTLQDKVDTYRNIVNSANFYPLRQYLDENLDVTVNTDNPFVSDSNMTKEYLVAARLTGGLSRWEILRLIKNGFRAAAIPKDEKRKLMNEIDDEIYEILQNEDL